VSSLWLKLLQSASSYSDVDRYVIIMGKSNILGDIAVGTSELRNSQRTPVKEVTEA
jgi:hypothetical protein